MVNPSLSNATEQQRTSEARRGHVTGPEHDASQVRLPIEKLYKLVAENTNDSISVTDLATIRVTYLSPSVEHVLGFRSEESVGNPLPFFLPPASLELGLKTLREQLAIERDGREDRFRSWTLEQEAYRKDGSTVWIESRCSFLHDDRGKAVGVVTIARDITERKLMEKALRDSEERYRTVFENSRDAFCIMSRDGGVIDVNQAALALFDYSREEARTLELQKLASTLHREKFQRLIEEKGFVIDYEMQMRRKNGTQIDCSLTFNLRRGEDGSILGYEGSIRDITEYKRLQQNLRLYINQVTQAQEEERRRIARELHDETIQALAALSLELLAATRRRGMSVDKAIGTMEQMRQRIDGVAEGLGRLSRALRPSVLDNLGLVPAVTLLLNDLNEMGKVHVSLRVAGRERRLSPEAELGLFRIVQEATNNVRKHSEAKRASVIIEFRRDEVRLTIKDHGKGFEVPRRLGDFSSAGRVGLMGMRERVQGLKGTFAVKSHLGKGTTITVEVPG
jgi:PAS domain S-box-containing protein